MRLLLIIATAILTSCTVTNVHQPANSYQPPGNTIEEISRFDRAAEAEWKKSKYDVLRNDFTIIEDQIAFTMLTNNGKSSPKQKQALAEIAQFQMEQASKKTKFVRDSGYPNEYATIIEAGLNYQVGVILDLYHERLTFGQAMMKIKDSNSQRRADIAELDRLYSQYNQEAAQRASALAIYRDQAFRQYLSNFQSNQQSFKRQHGTVSCSEVGNFTVCNY